MRDLPRGLYMTKSGRISVKCRVYDMKRKKLITLSCGVYSGEDISVPLAVRDLVKELVGPTIDSKRRVRITAVLDAVNEYRESVGMDLLKKRNNVL